VSFRAVRGLGVAGIWGVLMWRDASGRLAIGACLAPALQVGVMGRVVHLAACGAEWPICHLELLVSFGLSSQLHVPRF
jgi:hypothetical protein